MSEDGTVVSIDKKRGGGKRRGDQVAPPEKRSQVAAHLPADATRAEARRAGKVVRAKRRADVLTLAAHGHDLESIAETLTEKYKREGLAGISKSAVEHTINSALIDWQDNELSSIEKVRGMQLQRLDGMLRAISTKVAEGNLKAIDRALKIEALRAKITGTEAPKRLEVSGSIGLGIDPADVDREQQAWLDSGGDVIDVDPADVEEVSTDAPA